MKLAYCVAGPDTRDPGVLALRGDPAEVFPRLASLGYAGVDLMVRDPALLDGARLQSLAERAGLRIVSLSTGQVRKEDQLSLAHPDETARARAVDRGRAIIDLAAALEAQVNIGTLRGHLPEGPAREEARAAARASLQALIAHAAPRGVRVALEPQSRYIINWLHTVAEARAFIAGLAPPGAALVFDVYHALLEEASVFAALVEAGPLVSLVQVSDSNRLPPGAGHLPLGEVLRVLAAIGFGGYVAVEAVQKPTPHEAAARAARHLVPLLEQIASERKATPA